MRKKIVHPFYQTTPLLDIAERTKQRELDFGAATIELCKDICRHVPALSHINADDVAIIVRPKYRNVIASMCGSRWCKQYGLPKPHYAMQLYNPHFFDYGELDKLVIIIHELYHIAPEFDGNYRRFSKRYPWHGKSIVKYNWLCYTMRDFWLAQNPDPSLYEFLKYQSKDIGRISGHVLNSKGMIVHPKIVLK